MRPVKSLKYKILLIRLLHQNTENTSFQLFHFIKNNSARPVEEQFIQFKEKKNNHEFLLQDHCSDVIKAQTDLTRCVIHQCE